MKLLTTIFLIVAGMINVLAQDKKDDVIKYRTKEVCQFNNETDKWGAWKENSTLFTVLRNEDRIKVQGKTLVVYDIVDFKEKTERVNNADSKYYELTTEDPEGNQAVITFGDSGRGLVFIIHSGPELKTVLCYSVHELD